MPDWADRYRVLAPEAGNVGGRWRTATVEIGRGPMLAATEPGVHVITAMVATQLLKTSLLENIVGHAAHLDPCPMLLVQPKEAAAEQFSRERITPMVRATPVLAELVGSSRTRDKKESLLFKAFPGGFLALAGAGSPDNLARRPVRKVLYDEVDKYPVTREGNPIELGDERMATAIEWLSVRACSPTIAGESLIEESWLASDQRRASVECPHCQHRQFLDFFDHVEWPKDGERHDWAAAAVHCERCRRQWSEGERLRALRTIRWHQTRPFEHCGERQQPLEIYAALWRGSCSDPLDQVWDWWASNRHAVYRARCQVCGTWAIDNSHAGFQAGKLYSPWPKDSPANIAAKWLAAQGDEDRLQVWWNTQAGLPYRANTGKAIGTDRLLSRCEMWPAPVPDGVAVLTAGIDVQDYRVEAELVGWGRNEESWSIAYEVFDGEFDDPKLQARLDEWMKGRWLRADGRPFAITAACIDTGGHHTTAVYEFCKARLGRQIWGIKGESARTGQRNPVWPTKRPTSRTKKSYRPVVIGVNAAKDAIRGYLLKDSPGPGYCHFPVDRDLNYFKQLTAERVEVRQTGGHKYRVWVLPDGRANEALDCRVYAYAALHGLMHMNLRLNALADAVGAARGGEGGEAAIAAEQAPVADAGNAGAAAPEVKIIKVAPSAAGDAPRRVSLGALLARRGA